MMVVGKERERESDAFFCSYFTSRWSFLSLSSYTFFRCLIPSFVFSVDPCFCYTMKYVYLLDNISYNRLPSCFLSFVIILLGIWCIHYDLFWSHTVFLSSLRHFLWYNIYWDIEERLCFCNASLDSILSLFVLLWIWNSLLTFILTLENLSLIIFPSLKNIFPFFLLFHWRFFDSAHMSFLLFFSILIYSQNINSSSLDGWWLTWLTENNAKKKINMWLTIL